MSIVLFSCLVGGGLFLIYFMISSVAFRFLRLEHRFPFLQILGFVFLVVIFSKPYKSFLPGSFTVANSLDRFILIFIFLVAVYFFALIFYSALDHAVRLRLLVELLLNNSLNIDEVLKYYGPDEVALVRLNQLVLGGYLSKLENNYVLTKKGLFFARVTCLGWRFFNIKKIKP